MYVVHGRITRPNTNCSFYTIADNSIVSETIKQHWIDNYKTNGKCLFIDVTISENELQCDTMQYWENKDAYLNYKNDPVLITQLFLPREAYWSENNMTGVIVEESEFN